MLREKTIKYRKNTKISPLVYGIYDHSENFDENQQKIDINNNLKELENVIHAGSYKPAFSLNKEQV